MLRSLGLVGLILCSIVALLIVIGLAIYLGVENKSWLLFVIVLIGGCSIIYWIAKKIEIGINSVGRVDMSGWLQTIGNCKYKHACDGTGIGIDEQNRLVHLSSKFEKNFIRKTYKFEQVKKWGYVIPGANKFFGSSPAVGAINVMYAANAAENTFLWVSVSDIEYPIWNIKFFDPEMGNTKKINLELDRWMEILDQHINNA